MTIDYKIPNVKNYTPKIFVCSKGRINIYKYIYISILVYQGNITGKLNKDVILKVKVINRLYNI